MSISSTSTRGAVLITATSSGIGAACLEVLHRQGFWVFAGLRDMAKAQRLLNQTSNRDHVTPILLDVTQLDLIDMAVHQVSKILAEQEVPLVGIVNNHTCEHHGPLEILPMELIRQEMEVDYFGTLNVIKAFLPLLRRSQGRIINFSSLNGRCVFMSIGASCAAKYAVEAMSDTLRLELAPWNVHVSIIEPGATATSLWDTTQQAFECLPTLVSTEQLQLYYPSWRTAVNRASADNKAIYKVAQPPERVAQAVLHALTSSRPKVRYVVARPVEKLLLMTKWLLPDRWFDHIAMKIFNDQSVTKSSSRNN